MSPPSQTKPRGWLWPLVVAAAVAGSLMLYLRSVESRLLDDASVYASGAGQPAQIADVARALDAMSLVTVILETKVTATAADESWRGDVSASVTIPVRLLFGTDLSRARVDVTRLSPITRTYRITCPTPARLATELFTRDEAADVQLGWLRFRTRAGEYYLGEARKRLTDAAAAMTLTDADALHVRTQTHERVTALVRLVLGEEEANRSSIEVVFDDEGARPDGPEAAQVIGIGDTGARP